MSKSLGNVIDPLDVMRGQTLDQLVRNVEESNLPAEEKKTAITNLRMSTAK
jgi:valyl-tRNA synthetase